MADYKIGDRVRLEYPNGDTAVVTVAYVDSAGSFESTSVNYFAPRPGGWRVVEVIPKPVPVPDEPKGLGAVVQYTGDGDTWEGEFTTVRVGNDYYDWVDNDGDVITWDGILSYSDNSTIKVLSEGYVGSTSTEV